MIRYLGIALFIAAVLQSATARATSAQGQLAMKRWVTSDRCAEKAQKAFPDYTTDSLAKRNAMMQDCLNSQNLPPRELTPTDKP